MSVNITRISIKCLTWPEPLVHTSPGGGQESSNIGDAGVLHL
jgi:hypothetical protein